MKKLLNLKRLLGIRNKRGFTLAEIIIASALLGILVIGVLTFVSPVLNMVQSEQNSARATMLAEAIDTYITGCLRNARKVEIFTNTTLEEAQTYGMDADTSGALLNLTIFMGAGNNADIFEVRCLGINWLDDTSSPIGRKKLVVTNLKVDNNFSGGYANKLKILTTDIEQAKVFDDSMYFNLYPQVTLETFKEQEADGTEKATKAAGYKVSSAIYLDMECYNVISDAAREKSKMTFTGVSYVQCSNMRNGYDDVTGLPKWEPASDATPLYTTQNAIDANKSSRQYTENGTNYYYPDTLIYYIVYK